MTKIYLGGDHAGFYVKEKLKEYLDKKEINYEDLGPFSYNKKDDYPDYAFRVGEKVAKNKNSKGILICGSGAGVVIAANKIERIKAVAAYDVYTAKISRLHNDTNILGLSAWRTSFSQIKKIVPIWLSTSFSKARRHVRRINKIANYERKK